MSDISGTPLVAKRLIVDFWKVKAEDLVEKREPAEIVHYST